MNHHQQQRPTLKRARRRVARGVVLAAVAVLAAACSASASGSSDPVGPKPSTVVGALPSGAIKIMDKANYSSARWTYDVIDAKTGKVLLDNRPNESVFTGSTAKLFTIGTAFATMGPDSKITTPVYATGPVTNGVLDGNIVLVASGDLALGGRGAMQGRFDNTFSATKIDQVYGDIAPNAVKPKDDPLAGLDSLASQIRAKGITQVNGDVIIDTRLWDTYKGGEGPVTPIFVNDDLLDITVTPGAAGQPATVAQTPTTAAYTVTSSVKTVDGKQDGDFKVDQDPNNPHQLDISGTIGADRGPQLTVYRVGAEAPNFARTLFVEALQRAGVTVGTPAIAANNESVLPAKATYTSDKELASLKSPTMATIGSMILHTSYNTGANAVLCLIAAHEGSTDCNTGLKTIRTLIKKAGLESKQIFLDDGQGGGTSMATPQQVVKWLQWTRTQPWGKTLRSGLPVLGVDGTNAGVGRNSPAKGKVAAKTGTATAWDDVTGRSLFLVQSMAGYMTTSKGRDIIFDVSMSGGTYKDVQTGLSQSEDDVGMVAANIQQALSK